MADLNKKRILITAVFLMLFLVGTILIFTTPSSVKITYGLTTQTEDDETISFNIFEPRGRETELKKAVIIGHGVMVNKEMLKGYAIELAAAGFVAVPMDFRGHGQSSGDLKFNNLIYDVKAVKQYLLTQRDDIDSDNFGYIGYSMGGFPGNQIIKEDDDFKCFIGIGTSLMVNEEDPVKIDSGRELNILMIHALYDEAFNLEDIRESMADRLGKQSNEVEVNQLYGSFDQGTASMIFLDDNSDHLTLAWDQDFIRAARDWVKNTFPEVIPVDENFYVNIRLMILVMQVIGGIGLFFLLVEPISKILLDESEESKDEGELDDDSVSMLIKNIFKWSVVFAIPGLLISLPLIAFVPLLVAGIMIGLLLGQIIGLMFIFRKKSKERETNLKDLLLLPYKKPRERLIKELVVAVILTTLLYLILYLSFGLNYLGWAASIFRYWVIPPYFVLILVGFSTYGLMFQGIFQTRFGEDTKAVFKAAGIGFSIIMVHTTILILLACIIMRSMFAILLVMVGAPLFLLSMFVAAAVYQKTGSILIGAIVNSFFLVMIVATLSPFLNFFSIMEQLESLVGILH